VHQETRGFRQWNPLRLPMVLATDQETLLTEQPAMAHDQVVREHADRAAPKLAQGKNFEFDLHSRNWREFLCHFVQRGVIPSAVEEIVSAKKNIKFQVVVGPVAGPGFQYAAFAAAVTASEERRLQFSFRNRVANGRQDLPAS